MVLFDRALIQAALPAYEVGEELGRGGYGVVLRGRHRRLDRQVAIKILLVPVEVAEGQDRFDDEARVMATLDHPHVVAVHDYVEHEGLRCLVMEHQSGGTLRRRAEQGLAPAAVCAVVLAITEALHHAHEHHVLHRDMKPENVLFSGVGMPKVTDFGIAKLLEGTSSLASAQIGTPAYMSPEQIEGGHLHATTDVYAVGGMLCELLTGQPLFPQARSMAALIHHHLAVTPHVPDSLHPALAAVVHRSLRKAPTERQQSARALGLELAEAASTALGSGWLAAAGVPVRLDDDLREAAQTRSRGAGSEHVERRNAPQGDAGPAGRTVRLTDGSSEDRRREPITVQPSTSSGHRADGLGRGADPGSGAEQGPRPLGRGPQGGAPWRRAGAVGAVVTAVVAIALGLTLLGPDAGAPPRDSGAGSPADPSATPAVASAATLEVGTLLPRTGSLAFLGPPTSAAAQLAVNDIDAAGGVLGKPMQKIDADSGDAQSDIAQRSVDELMSKSVDAIVGAVSSAVSLSVVDEVTAAGVLQISPANTSDDLTSYADDGLFFRTAPADRLQAQAVGDLIAAEGSRRLGIMAIDEVYGDNLLDGVTEALEGRVEVVSSRHQDGTDFSRQVSEMKAEDPDALLVVGFSESAALIAELARQGIGPQQGKKLYLVDGNIGNALGQELPDGLLRGVKGTLPGVAVQEEFRRRLLDVNPDLLDFSYGPETYDAVVVVALAAEVARSDKGSEVAARVQEVTGGGTKCTTVAACMQLARAGRDLDYDGVSGPLAIDQQGDVTVADIPVYTYGADNQLLPSSEHRRVSL